MEEKIHDWKARMDELRKEMGAAIALESEKEEKSNEEKLTLFTVRSMEYLLEDVGVFMGLLTNAQPKKDEIRAWKDRIDFIISSMQLHLWGKDTDKAPCFQIQNAIMNMEKAAHNLDQATTEGQPDDHQG